MKSTPEACEKRDVKAHYQKARQGEFHHFPGVDVDYEPPIDPELVIDVDNATLDEMAEQIVRYLKSYVMNEKNKAQISRSQAKPFTLDLEPENKGEFE